ncbi:RNA polymerase sigma factor [Streptomyces poriferorum]|uniref:RNA polymerase sigma factor n=1 Tax=Streptomyces poriferorum TaxID=2798799 RepID=A0ABY9IWC5_9ACTN|nr:MULTISPECIES: RNA polymerase sigma factor [Streptomyces]MBW5254713.1 RNA polymerase sigma factor [Streptomyces poriferorum]MBW5260955.1 RNA polymerase sigma factor [Streptomyces poriferorum]MDP5311197.1 RNA polymerase sigma factor [Streptomyces sp. Alt4]WLQ47620.1 RNA polymerase sigma factor [Streptomyces sp. Alt1]WLQ59691.1 RNA polymerase sigma factor [Streptomyces sp. Alt2]
MTGPPRDDDAAVVSRSLERPETFALLYDRYAADIHRYAARRLGEGAAEDITADTFLVAFRSRARFDTGRDSARPWLYGIAANLIGKHRRTEVRALRALARTGTDPVAESWTASADHRVSAQAAHSLLAGALASLSAGDRHVLLLIAWADLSYQEVADALSVPVGTVRSRLNRARRKVRQTLGADPTVVTEGLEVAHGHG